MLGFEPWHIGVGDPFAVPTLLDQREPGWLPPPAKATSISETRDLVRAFQSEVAGGDPAAAIAMLSDQAFTFWSPLITAHRPTDLLGPLQELQSFLVDATLVSELYGPGEATLIADVRLSAPVRRQRVAEHFGVERGKINSIIALFDATEWRPLLAKGN